ncbi:hypothetical protein HETIRDRAFT_145132 [Heterobasidion irregulare TC 32-1]|uniref:Uncharacterized protein n=1 Tax=Heterobasidion irregulare (strain TC 32-1) TaxID=747525 RepID=W4KLI8_HETIT|nr:uncharacterized protein HETIRDRAFT_145132 [Heterobasidion irregulare TC 32-1]ETW86692.1 hypothetical protein HETIRDRAFT_145132 [Heterobasidion irregulare TC 32-1]
MVIYDLLFPFSSHYYPSHDGSVHHLIPINTFCRSICPNLTHPSVQSSSQSHIHALPCGRLLHHPYDLSIAAVILPDLSHSPLTAFTPAPIVHLSLTEVSRYSSIPWPPLYAYLTYATQYMQQVATVPSMMALIFSPSLSSPFRHSPSTIFLFPKTRCRCADVVRSAHRTDLIMLSHTCQCLDIVDADSSYIHTSVPAHI